MINGCGDLFLPLLIFDLINRSVASVSFFFDTSS